MVSKRDVVKAFERVIKSDDVLKSHCFAFFIDGLDEFQSTVQDDHRDLVRLLCQWAASESGNIKICVSSREYPVFMDGFTPTLRIRFHDLTRRDMDTYIRDKLAHASAEESFETLVSLIMRKADGVFLWVALVVKSLREGLENGLSCSDLMHEVDILPDQLESLYRHILASLGKSARRKAYRTFAMVMELKKWNYRMSLLAYSFLEEYDDGKSFFMRENNGFPINSLIGDRGKERVQSTSRRLAGWCKGLVEPYKKPIWVSNPRDAATGKQDESPCIAAWREWSMELDFAHRSVSDFLEYDDVQRDMQLNLTRFDPVDAVLNLILSDILFESSTSIYNTSRSGITQNTSGRIIDHYGLSREPFTYFNRVRGLLAAAKPSDQMTSRTLLSITYYLEDGSFVSFPRAEFVVKPAKALEERSSSRRREHYVSDPLHTLTLRSLCDYPLWLIANNPSHSEQPSTIVSLACLLLDEEFGCDRLERLLVLEALFEQGWVSPDTITDCRLTRYRGWWSQEFGDHSNLSLWQHFLMKMLSVRYFEVPEQSIDSIYHEHYFEVRPQYDARLLYLFLQFKQDPEFSFEIRMDEETPPWRRDFVLHFGEHSPVVKMQIGDQARIGRHLYRRNWEEKEIGLPLADGVPARRHISLREFIEHSFFDNKTELLKMLDQNSEKNAHNEKETATTAPTVEKDDYMGGQTKSGYDGIQTRSANRLLEPRAINNLELHLDTVSPWARVSLNNEYVRYAAAVLTGEPLSSCEPANTDTTMRKD